MKKILNILMAALVLTGISCSEDLEYKPGDVTPVQTLLLPADNYYVELQSASTATLRFSWEPALAADGQLPHYEVVFFGKPGGEIIYRCDAGSSTRRSTASPMPRASTSGPTVPSIGRSCRAGAWIPRLWLRRPAGWN